jgi:hypothetical protein
VDNAWKQEKLEAADSHTSGVRSVGRFSVVQDTLPEKRRPANLIRFTHNLAISNNLKTQPAEHEQPTPIFLFKPAIFL